MNLKIEYDPKAYGQDRQYIITFGISHLAYGATPEEAVARFRRRFP
jgi:hypothetical protein